MGTDISNRARRHVALTILLAVAPKISMAERVYRIGTLGVEAFDPTANAMTAELARRGYVLGRNLQFVVKICGNDVSLLDALAAELVVQKVDLIISLSSGASTRAAMRATKTIPIVMSGSSDPVESGFVASLARPGGNVTGNAEAGDELSVKRMQLLMEAVGKARPVGILVYEPLMARPRQQRVIAALERLAKSRGTTLVVATVRKVDRGDDLDRSLDLLKRGGAVGVLVSDWATIGADSERVASVLMHYGLASIMEWGGGAEAGVFMTYAEPDDEPERRVAVFVDHILKGAIPATLPVERGTRFELVINLKTAAALQITVPRALLLRADKLIQ